MAEYINLIPESERQEQVKEKAVKLSTVFFFVALLIVAGIAGYFYYQKNLLDGQITELDGNITGLRSEIQSLSETEIVARNLYTKYLVLSSIFTSRSKYSFLLSEFQKRTSQGIQIDNFTLSGNILTISGNGDTYLTVAKFMQDLTDTRFPGSDPGFEKLFKSVTLNSVTLNNSQNKATFFITVDFDDNLIKGK